jgi:hypothetical protein
LNIEREAAELNCVIDCDASLALTTNLIPPVGISEPVRRRARPAARAPMTSTCPI